MPEVVSRNEREVGRVVAVSNYRVTVLLDPGIRSQVRAFQHNVALITQIGGYVLFPVAPGELVVGIIVGAFEDESLEAGDDQGMSLHFGRARRTLRVNLAGQLHEDLPFEGGVSTYPTLDTPAFLPTEDELGRILQYQPAHKEKDDVALAIGSSPIYSRQHVRASFNDLLARPFGIIGNTGSGKSCSVASILQTALAMNDSAARLAKIIILDINGEYGRAWGFEPRESGELNHVYLNGENFSLPLWTFNLSELISFFDASQASQVPVLERVVTAARERALDPEASAQFRAAVDSADSCFQYLDRLLVFADAPNETYFGKKAREIVTHLRSAIEPLRSSDSPIEVPQEFADVDEELKAIERHSSDHNISPDGVQAIREFVKKLKPAIEGMRTEAVTRGGLRPITADSPVPFPADSLRDDRLFYSAISRFRGQERIQEYIATMRLRIHRQLSDKRWLVFTQPSELNFDELLSALIGQPENRVVIIDCSLLAHDVLPLFCAVVGRLILELRAHSIPANRIDQPYVLVLEEAHNYLKPRREDELPGTTAAREAFERIAKEGRKFGLSLIIASQRPSDVSATVLSQCANFLVHRIQNPEDLDYFKKILPTGSRDLLDQLPILAPGDAILLGSATNVPARVTVRLPHPKPQSETPKPWKAWQSSSPPFDVATSAAQWIQETGSSDMEMLEDDPADPEPPDDPF